MFLFSDGEERLKTSPQRAFLEYLASANFKYLLFDEMPCLERMGPAEHVEGLGGYLCRDITGWYHYISLPDGSGAILYYRPYPGREYPRAGLEEVRRLFPDKLTDEFYAMYNFSVYSEGNLSCFRFKFSCFYFFYLRSCFFFDILQRVPVVYYACWPTARHLSHSVLPAVLRSCWQYSWGHLCLAGACAYHSCQVSQDHPDTQCCPLCC